MRQPPIKSTLVAILASIAIVFIVTRPRHVQAAGFVVNSLADSTFSGDGLCTLREAIQSANNAGNGDCGANSGSNDTITFSVPGTFRLSSTLPNIVSGQGTLTINGAGTVTISGDTDNNGTGDVRVLWVDSGANLTLQNLTITKGNVTGSMIQGAGGGVFIDGGTLTVTNCTFAANNAVFGGGIVLDRGALTVSNSTFSGNTGTVGGGIYSIGVGTVDVTDSTFTGNTAANGGGAIFNIDGVNNDGPTATVTNCTFTGNVGNGGTGGGAILNAGASSMSVTNSTFFNNSSNIGRGGAIFNSIKGILNVTNCTLSGNSGTDGGTIATDVLTEATLRNTIITNTLFGLNCSGTFEAAGTNNLVTNENSCGPGTTLVTVFDLKLGGLASNGGPTQTMALLPSSVAIDTGNDTVCSQAAGSPLFGAGGKDQRGIARPFGPHCDIGAYESNPSQTGNNLVVNVLGDTDDGSCDLLGQGSGNLDCTLREAINATNGAGGADQITFNVSGTITVGSQLPNINDTLTIDGGNVITISGGGTTRVFQVSNGRTFTLKNATVTNGKATDALGGGGLRNDGTVTLTNVTFSNNHADTILTAGGGGVSSQGTVNATNCTFSGNSAFQGGAITNRQGGTLNLTNSTFFNNSSSALGAGGAVINSSSSTTNIINCTFSGNGGALTDTLNRVSGTLTLKNTIVANTVANKNCSGTITDGGGNLQFGGTVANSCGASITTGDPNLVALASNGGPTQTMALGVGSAAINLGSATTCAANAGPPDFGAGGKDQRGINRRSGFCDSGAFEAQPASNTVTGGSGQSTVINSAFANPLQVAVKDTNNNLLGGIVVTFIAPASGASAILSGNPALTNGSGLASVNANANGIPGGPYNVAANATGVTAVNLSLTNTKANQTIDVGTHAPAAAGFNSNFPVAATATSGLTVTYSSSGSCTNVGPLFTMTSGTGACTVKYDQAGDPNYNAAPQVIETVTAQKINQTINVGSHAPATANFNSNFTVAATSSSGLAVSYSSSGVCTNSGPVFTMTSGTGTCTVKYDQAGDNNYNPAPQVPESVTAQKINQTINVGTHAPANATFNTNFTVAATATSGLTVTYGSSGSCANAGPVFTMTSGTGTCTVKYDQAGDNDYNPATQVTESVTAQKANQSINVGTRAPANATFNTNFTVVATATSGLAVTYGSSGSCTNAGPVFTMNSGTGTCSVKFDQVGDGNYNPATQTTETVTAQRANQTISVGTHAPASAVFNSSFTVAATAGSNLVVAYSSSGGCTNLGPVFTMTSSTDICTVKYDQGGDPNYNAATQVIELVIPPVPTTTSLTSSLNPSPLGQTVTLTATIDQSTATVPSGTVQFKIDAANTGSPVSLSGSGRAQLFISFLTAGTHTVTAEYSGDSYFAGSTGTLAGGQVVTNRAFVNLSSSSYNVNESSGFVTITVNRTGDLSVPVTVDYSTNDTGAPSTCNTTNRLASARCDFGLILGTLRFAATETQKTFVIPITVDAYTEGAETFTVTLSNLTGAAVVFFTPSSATVTINDSTSPTANAIDDTDAFVRQHYHDFLNREADATGLAFWKNNIDKCNDPAQRQPGETLAQCLEVQRILTSGAFLLSIEFQQTGGLVRDFYVAALNRSATRNNPTLVEFERDMQAVQAGLIVGVGNWQQTLNSNRSGFMNDFVTRAEFVGLYPTTDAPTQYVDKLYLHAAVTPGTPQERADAIAEFGAAGTAADPGARGRALFRITQNAAFHQREMNRCFVYMEYIGYLRRNPNDPPDGNFVGFDFWVNKLNQFSGDFFQAEMLKAFITSGEYRRRFGP